ncbi:hypothetical protein NWP17_02585 [Chrysosporum bergii ANA360D]|uniref:Uncharacterized protein n=1 Tax=Chrysosporum bergii ANA360D TaxID=617107 RepID=A0AA43KA98_9CYAN|nr:hypothetical protein [Chrysosporum bergii]MDH6059336.1 hypothetical protein [Chrysosporum bergii ANA360D]
MGKIYQLLGDGLNIDIENVGLLMRSPTPGAKPIAGNNYPNRGEWN